MKKKCKTSINNKVNKQHDKGENSVINILILENWDNIPVE